MLLLYPLRFRSDFRFSSSKLKKGVVYPKLLKNKRYRNTAMAKTGSLQCASSSYVWCGTAPDQKYGYNKSLAMSSLELPLQLSAVSENYVQITKNQAARTLKNSLVYFIIPLLRMRAKYKFSTVHLMRYDFRMAIKIFFAYIFYVGLNYQLCAHCFHFHFLSGTPWYVWCEKDKQSR